MTKDVENNALVKAFTLDSSKCTILSGTAEAHIDLNNFTTLGNYLCQTNAAAQYIDNGPTKVVSYRLLVLTSSSSTSIYQIAIVNQTSRFLSFRRKVTSGSSWSEWEDVPRMTTINDIQSDISNLQDDLLRVLTLDSADCEILSGSAEAHIDLNDYTTPGNFVCQTNAMAAYIDNGPSSTVSYRLAVLTSNESSYVYQFALLSQTTRLLSVRRKMGVNAAWSDWLDFATTDQINGALNKTINATNITLTAENYSTYFPNGSFNDAPINSIVGISVNVPLTDGPDGDSWIGYGSHSATGYIRGTLLTFRANAANDTAYSGLTQILIGYRTAGYSPTFSYRIAIQSNSSDRYAWSSWSKFEENGYLHSGNKVISAGRMSESVYDLNDLPQNVIYQIDRNCDGLTPEATLGHHPAPGKSCIVSSIAFSYSTPHGQAQTVYVLDGRIYWRYGYQNDVDDYRWTEWKRLATEIPEPPQNNGEYLLKCTVNNGVASYTWVVAT